MAKAQKAAQAASDKKAKEIVILKLRDLSVICDYFVICSGDSTTQVKAISENVGKVLKEKGSSPIGSEGESNAHWVLIDYGDVIVHVFEGETRRYYELEKLWLDAPRIDFTDEGKNPVGRKDKRTVSGRGHQ
ncbi:MAG: ribosome silencing factor [Nitrospiraceae bacterium]|nr:ribosome silencing factor [Nitrospiraceae bacterium]